MVNGGLRLGHTGEPRAAEITKPLKLGRIAVIAGMSATAVMVATLSLGVGRNALGFAPKLPPGRIELRVQNPGASAAAAFQRQIGMTSDGSAVLFMTQNDNGQNVVESQDIDSDRSEIVDGADSIPDETDTRQPKIEGEATRAVGGSLVEMRYAAGHIVYVKSDGSLWAAPFDRNSGRVTAKPVQIGANVSLTGTGIAQFAVSRNGNVAYLPEGPRSLVTVTHEGILRSATTERGSFGNPRFSPDGKRISVDLATPEGRDVWTVAVGSERLERATFERDAHDAVWTPDGTSITYTSYRLGALGIYRARPGQKATHDSLLTAQSLVYSGEWLSDGSGIVTTASDLEPGSKMDVALVSQKGEGPIIPVIADRFETRSPTVSHDGKWLAYVSNETGRDEVYVRPWMRGGDVFMVSARGGTEPVWSPDAGTLYYRESVSQDLVGAVMNHTGKVLVLGRQFLFPIKDMVPGFSHANYDVSPDGRTFVMVRRSAGNGITVLSNVPEIVRRTNTPPVTAGKR